MPRWNLPGLSKDYLTLNQIEISPSALEHNLEYFARLNNTKVAPVLKSNAYGHGLKLVGKFISNHLDVPYICVDSLYEAYTLRKSHVRTPILIIGYTNPENFKIWKKLPFTLPIFDLETIKVLSDYQKGVKIHIKIDTGMNRLGLMPHQIQETIKLIKKYPHLKVEGIYSHFSQADNPQKKEFTQNQIRVFHEAIKIFEGSGIKFKWKHILATSGAFLDLRPSFNLMRLGIGFYGVNPLSVSHPHYNNLASNLRPALKLMTHIAQIKEIGEGSEVGYGGTFIAPKSLKIAVLPIGYYDGVDRRLSNRGLVRVGESYCPIIGRISMNVTTIDISNVPQVKVGDKVVIFDDRNISKNSVARAADLVEMIPYELLTGLSETTKRRLV